MLALLGPEGDQFPGSEVTPADARQNPCTIARVSNGEPGQGEVNQPTHVS